MPHLRRTAVLAVATACVASLLAMGATASAATVAAGEAQSCAVFTGGTLKCWGSNSFGSLGIGSTSSTPTAVPTQVVGLTSGVTDVRLAFSGGGSAGVGCAVVNGGARCWGRNGGNIGNGTSGGGVIAPVTPVGLDAGVTQVTVSASDSAALQNGVIKGFGGSSGKFAKQSLVPVAVGPPGGVAEIAEGWRHACYLLQTGAVACVGDNTNGQLGASGPGTASAVAGQTTPATPVAAGGGVSRAQLNGGVDSRGSPPNGPRRVRLVGQQRPGAGRGSHDGRHGHLRVEEPHLRHQGRRRVLLGRERKRAARRRHHEPRGVGHAGAGEGPDGRDVHRRRA